MAADEMLKGNIRFWESMLFHDRFVMNTSTITFIEQTIKYLKELQEIKEEK